MPRPTLRLPALAGLLLAAAGLRAQYDANTIRAYVEEWWPVAVGEMEAHGIPASISLAQGILESGAGTSELTRRANNHFGIKCHKEWTGKSVRYDDDARDECFRSYPDAAQSWADHSAFLTSRSRYAELFTLKRDDYEGWARGLKKAGYATNPRYADLLIKLIRDYELHQYDRMDARQMLLAGRDRHRRGLPEDVPHRPSAERPTDAVTWFNRVPMVRAREGERPADLASRHGLKLSQLCAYNDFGPDRALAAGEPVYLKPKRRKAADKRHRVLPGQTLRDVSQRHAVRLDLLAARNGVAEDFIPAPGEFIELRGKADAPPRAAGPADRERALAGQRLAAAGTPPARPAAGGTDPEPVDFVPVSGTPKPGQEPPPAHRAPADAGDAAAGSAAAAREEPAAAPSREAPAADTPSPPPAAAPRTHEVRPGETLYALSRRYGVSVDELRSWNRLGDATIRVGQTLVVGR